MKTSFASPASFLAALLCFLLPFATIKCNGGGDKPMDIGTLSGLELVKGDNLIGELPKKDINQPNNDLKTTPENINIYSSWARLAFLMGLLGLITSFLKLSSNTKQRIIKGTSLLGTLSLIAMFLFTEAWYRHQSLPLIFEYRFGFYLTLGCFLITTAINWRPIRKRTGFQHSQADLLRAQS